MDNGRDRRTIDRLTVDTAQSLTCAIGFNILPAPMITVKTESIFSRRRFLTSAGTAGVSALLGVKRFLAQTTSSTARSVRIDIHHHIVPPGLLQALGTQRLGAASANWTVSRSLGD